jgi:hypothetical protein
MAGMRERGCMIHLAGSRERRFHPGHGTLANASNRARGRLKACQLLAAGVNGVQERCSEDGCWFLVVGCWLLAATADSGQSDVAGFAANNQQPTTKNRS